MREQRSFSCLRVFVFSCVLAVGLTGSAAAQPATTALTAQTAQTAPARRIAVAPAAAADTGGPQGYSVVLVLGDMQTAASGDGNVPAAARKALTDMKDFLPYKSYRLLDAQWILGSQRTVSRLRGPNDQDYELTLRGESAVSAPEQKNKLRVSFRLQDAAADGSPGALLRQMTLIEATTQRGIELQALQRQAEVAEAEAARLRESLGERHPDVVKARERAAEARAKALAEAKVATDEKAKRASAPVVARDGNVWMLGGAVIDTSFTMDIGETVVVGTSRVRGGDKALIALLTAVAKK